MNPIPPLLRVKIRNKIFDDIATDKAGEEEEKYIHALLQLIRDKKPEAMLASLREIEEGDEKSEAMYLLALHYMSTDNLKSFNRFKRELGDRSKLPYERSLYSILRARENRNESHYEIAIGFLTEAEKTLDNTEDLSKVEILAQLRFEEGLNYIRLKQYQEAIDSFEKGLTAIHKLQVPLIRGRILSAIGDLQETLENYTEAATYYQHALNELKLCEDTLPAIYVKIKITQLMEEFDNLSEVEALLNDILLESDEHTEIQAYCYSTLGRIYNTTERYDESLEAFNKSIELQKILDSPGEIAVIHNSKGNLYLSMEEFDKAIFEYQESLDYWEKVQDLSYIASIQVNIGKAYFENADLQNAISYFQKSIELQEKLDTKFSIVSSYNNLALMSLEFGNVMMADEFLEQSKSVALELKDDRLIAEVLTSKSVIALLKGDLGQLEQYLVQARDFGYSCNDINIMLDTSLNLGIFYFHTKQKKLAENIMWQALDYSKNANDTLSAFESLEYLRRINYSINKRKLKILKELNGLEGDLGYSGADWDILMDFILCEYILFGRDRALESLRAANEHYVKDLMEKESIFRKLTLQLRKEEPDEIFLGIISILVKNLEDELLLQNHSIRISQFILNLYHLYQDQLSDRLFQPLQKLMINAGKIGMTELEVSTKFVLNKMSGSMISDIDNLTEENWLDVLTNPITWMIEGEVIEEIFHSIPNISIMHYSLSMGTIAVNDVQYMLSSSKKIVELHISKLVKRGFLEEIDGKFHITDLGRRVFGKFSSTLEGKLITRIAS